MPALCRWLASGCFDSRLEWFGAYLPVLGRHCDATSATDWTEQNRHSHADTIAVVKG